jgi:ATP-dependent protease HslVU (ClpYQ) peptidase subunit
MCTEFIDGIRDCFKRGGFAEKYSEAERGGVFLVGYKNRLFKIEGDYQVGESYDDFDSCGCGESFALGALKAMSEETDAEDRVKKALEVATHFSAGVRPPFVIETT